MRRCMNHGQHSFAQSLVASRHAWVPVLETFGFSPMGTQLRHCARKCKSACRGPPVRDTRSCPGMPPAPEHVPEPDTTVSIHSGIEALQGKGHSRFWERDIVAPGDKENTSWEAGQAAGARRTAAGREAGLVAGDSVAAVTWRNGKRTVKVLPFPGPGLVAVIVPPC